MDATFALEVLDKAPYVTVNFATKLQNAGKDVIFLLAWNRPHSGDYSLDELFLWIADIVKKNNNQQINRNL